MADENITPVSSAEPEQAAPPSSGAWAPEHVNPETASALAPVVAAVPEPVEVKAESDSYVPRTATRFYKGLSPEQKAIEAKLAKTSGKGSKVKDGE